MSATSTPTKAGIVELKSGERHIPSSIRPDGTKRKEIKIRPGYKPIEDVEVYKNRTAESWKRRGNGGIPGAEGLKEESSAINSNSKNSKRREARKKAKGIGDQVNGESVKVKSFVENECVTEDPIDPEAKREKMARNLKKKLKQARELKEKGQTGSTLLPEQLIKITKINELIRELNALGFESDGEEEA